MDQVTFSNSNLSEEPLYEFASSGPWNQNQDHALEEATSKTYSRIAVRKSNPPSCNLCRRRKIRCDRADPCSHCVRNGAVCVSSPLPGAPRGRQGGRRKLYSDCKPLDTRRRQGSRRELENDLLDRIARLENLVKGIEGGTIRATSIRPMAAYPIDTV